MDWHKLWHWLVAFWGHWWGKSVFSAAGLSGLYKVIIMFLDWRNKRKQGKLLDLQIEETKKNAETNQRERNIATILREMDSEEERIHAEFREKKVALGTLAIPKEQWYEHFSGRFSRDDVREAINRKVSRNSPTTKRWERSW
ncbi:MAG: hypothetical protein ABSF92_01855 [Candidatus Acidiferrales bacterium]|jgi:hypothetical protein